jgi:hypothetical protein
MDETTSEPVVEKFTELEHVGTLALNKEQEIRFNVVRSRGKRCGDVRCFAVWGDVKEMRPTKRGFALVPGFYKKFETLVKELGAKL